MYFVHDLADAAVARRLRMLASVDDVTVIGFRRSGGRGAAIEGRPVVELGRTFDASFGQRILALGRACLRAGGLRAVLDGADLIIARQLEMLALAVVTRRGGTPVVYECLDIHRLMLGSGLVGRLLRWIERMLMRRASCLMVSSPAFLTSYFERFQRGHPPVLLVENKVLRRELAADAWDATRSNAPRPAGPWRIGWFGMLRCRRSLQVLADLVRMLPGQVEVVLRGRPSITAIPDFDALVAGCAGLRFEGPYDRARDLGRIYGEVDFVWCIDFFEAGGNSDWLLPNRLYEGSLFGCVPLAMRGVETGRWLAAHGCGVLFDEPLLPGLAAYFGTLNGAEYARQRAAVGAVRLEDLTDTDEDCAKLVGAVRALTVN